MTTAAPPILSPDDPPRDCPLCPRLVAFREEQRAAHPGWHNAPIPRFGDPDAWLAVVGLAPGMQGANRTGRAFTGDFAGVLLYATLARFGLSRGTFAADPDDGLTLEGTAIVNAVRCLPPQNKPTPAEINTCRPYLAGPLLAGLPKLRVVVALGRIAHDSTVKALGGRLAAHKFGHGAEHRLGGLTLIDSYHSSRYNQNTGVLTPAMFAAVFARAVAIGRG